MKNRVPAVDINTNNNKRIATGLFNIEDAGEHVKAIIGQVKQRYQLIYRLICHQ